MRQNCPRTMSMTARSIDELHKVKLHFRMSCGIGFLFSSHLFCGRHDDDANDNSLREHRSNTDHIERLLCRNSYFGPGCR